MSSGVKETHERLAEQIDRLLVQLPPPVAAKLSDIEENEWNLLDVQSLFEAGLSFLASVAISGYMVARASAPSAAVELGLDGVRAKLERGGHLADGDYRDILKVCVRNGVAGISAPHKADLPETARLGALIERLTLAARHLGDRVTADQLDQYLSDDTKSPPQIEWVEGWAKLVELRNKGFAHEGFQFKYKRPDGTKGVRKLRRGPVTAVSGPYFFAALIELLNLPDLDDWAIAGVSADDGRLYVSRPGKTRNYFKAPSSMHLELKRRYLLKGLDGEMPLECVPFHDLEQDGIPLPAAALARTAPVKRVDLVRTADKGVDEPSCAEDVAVASNRTRASLPKHALQVSGTGFRGVIGGAKGPLLLALRGDTLVLESHDGTEVAHRTISGASSVALSPDGRTVVAGTALGFVPVEVSGSKLVVKPPIEIPDLGPVLATWAVGDARLIASAMPANGHQVRRARDWSAVSGWQPPPELGQSAEWTDYVQWRDAAASLDQAGRLRTSGPLASALGALAGERWSDLDLAMTDAGTGIFAGLRHAPSGRAELVVDMAERGRWRGAIAIEISPAKAVHVARSTELGMDTLVALQEEDLLRGWVLRDLLPSIASA